MIIGFTPTGPRCSVPKANHRKIDTTGRGCGRQADNHSAGSSTGSGTDLFTYNGTALTNNSLFTTSSGYSFTISYDAGGNNDVTLALTAIPEPGTWAMVLSGTGTLLVFQRARRRSKL